MADAKLTALSEISATALTDVVYIVSGTTSYKSSLTKLFKNIPLTGINLGALGTPTYTTLNDFINNQFSSSIISGFTITDGGSGTIDIAAGTAIIKTTDSDLGAIVSADYAGTSGLALTDENVNYVYYDYNSGTPVCAATTDITTLDLHTQIPIGIVFRTGTTTHISNVPANFADFNMKNTYRLFELYGKRRASGLVTSHTGTRNIAITAGVIYFAHLRFTLSAFDSSVAGTFSTWYNDGAWQETASQTAIDNTQYNDYGTGLATLTAQQYGVHWIFTHEDGHVHSVYGTDSYLIDDALAAEVPANLPPMMGNCLLIAKIIIVKSASSFAYVIYPWNGTTTWTAINDHNELASLQGGTTSEYYHLTNAQHTLLTATETTITDDDAKIPTSGAVVDLAAGRTVSIKTDNYTFVITDRINHMIMNAATAKTFTVPAEASVNFAVGTTIPILNIGAGELTIAITSDTLNEADSYVKLAQGRAAYVVKTASTVWWLVGETNA